MMKYAYRIVSFGNPTKAAQNGLLLSASEASAAASAGSVVATALDCGAGASAAAWGLAAGFFTGAGVAGDCSPRTTPVSGCAFAISAGFSGTCCVTAGGVFPTAGVPNSCTTNVVRRPLYIPCAVAMPISVYFGFRRFSRCVGEFIHALLTSAESEKSTARFSPAYVNL